MGKVGDVKLGVTAGATTGVRSQNTDHRVGRDPRYPECKGTAGWQH